MTFEECVLDCAANKELVYEFDRLTGHNLSMKGSPIVLMIDEATGKQRGGSVRGVRPRICVGTVGATLSQIILETVR
jgi:hypothetical protein